MIDDAAICRWLSGVFFRELDHIAISAYMTGGADPLLNFLAEDRDLVSQVGRVCRAIEGWSTLSDRRLTLAADFGMLFLGDGHWGATPFASVYIDPAGRMLQAPHDRMVQRLRRIGSEVRRDLKEPADHLAVMLEYLALRLENPAAQCPDEEPAGAFVRAEMLPWVGQLRDRADRTPTQSDFHAACIGLTTNYLTRLS